MPPGGLAIYTGDEIPEWKGDALIGVLGFGGATGHLHRIRLDAVGNVTLSEVYLLGEYGRLRDVIMGPDGGLYVTTSNCDGRGDCPGCPSTFGGKASDKLHGPFFASSMHTVFHLFSLIQTSQ